MGGVADVGQNFEVPVQRAVRIDVPGEGRRVLEAVRPRYPLDVFEHQQLIFVAAKGIDGPDVGGSSRPVTQVSRNNMSTASSVS